MFFRFHLTFAVAAALSTAPAAGARDLGNGFSLTGDVQLEYLDLSGDSGKTYGIADVTLGWRSQQGGPIGFGFDISHFRQENPDDATGYSIFWGGAVVTSSYGELTIGRPRPLLDQFSMAPSIGTSSSMDLKLQGFFGSYMAHLQIIAPTIDSKGIGFKGRINGFSYGVGVHEFDNSGVTQTVFDIAASYESGPLLVYAGYERLPVEVASVPDHRALAGLRYAADRWAVGAEFNWTEYPFGTIEAKMIFGEYQVSDSLLLGLQYLDAGPSGNDPYYGASGIYSFDSGAFAEIGYFKGGAPGSEYLSASVGFEF